MPVNGKSRFCRRCGKPVFFAERKTSLGEDWHPTCLRCEKCTKVLTPGQHAEHKGLPFCNPCYQSLYGPQILGYGSNVYTAANFNKRYSQNNNNNNNGVPCNTISEPWAGQAVADLLSKLEEYNSHLTNGRSHCKLSSLQEESGSTVVQGPLRIYWGLESPIQLKQTDEVTPVPAPSTSSTWRHSYFQAVTNGNITPEKKEPKPKISEPPPRTKLTRGLDDSALLSPTSEASPVVLRRNRGLRKFNTVAYRGDQGNRWKRASINGHIYNHDTRVFVPVVGSCTNVTVTSAMATPDVIKTLLEKFKVENQAYEFSLHVVPDKGDPRLLRDSDYPLLERLTIGCDEKLGKIFIREKTVPEVPVEAWKTLSLPEAVQRLPTPDVSLTEVTELTEKKEQLPEEVEQLANLPEAVLRGFLQKFKNDEEQEVKKIQRKYELAKYMVRKRMKESQA